MSNLATAIKIQNATADVMRDEELLELAANIYAGIREGVFITDPNEFGKAIFEYTAHTVATTATLVSSACLGNTLFDTMLNEIKEMENITREIEAE
jgi:hypothetical protein